MKGMRVFKWGVIGPGNIAQAFAADLQFAKTAIHTVHAVLSRHKDHAANFSEQFQVSHSFTDPDQFLKAGVDAVYIATPHVFHTDQAMLCLQHRIPVLCEKPITINEKQLLQLIELSVQYNTFLLEGMWIRFLPSIEKVLSLLASGV